MSDGITHARYATGAALIVTGVAATAAVTVHPAMSGLIVGAWAAVVATPDLDHHVHTFDRQRIWRFNRALGTLWAWYWYPYERLTPHRGRSHNLLAGTFDRYMLLFWLPIALSLWLALSWWLVAWWCMVYCGQVAVDAVHLWLDELI